MGTVVYTTALRWYRVQAKTATGDVVEQFLKAKSHRKARSRTLNRAGETYSRVLRVEEGSL